MNLWRHLCCCLAKKELLCCEVIVLKELYMHLPVTLKKQISIYVGIALLSTLLFFIVVIFSKDLVLALPCMLFSIFMIIKAVSLFYTCIVGNYIEIKGVCSDVEIVGFRKKVKSITLKAENKLLKLPIHYKLKNVNIGDNLTVYMSKHTKLYYKDDNYIAGAFYGIHVEKGN